MRSIKSDTVSFQYTVVSKKHPHSAGAGGVGVGSKEIQDSHTLKASRATAKVAGRAQHLQCVVTLSGLWKLRVVLNLQFYFCGTFRLSQGPAPLCVWSFPWWISHSPKLKAPLLSTHLPKLLLVLLQWQKNKQEKIKKGVLILLHSLRAQFAEEKARQPVGL